MIFNFTRLRFGFLLLALALVGLARPAHADVGDAPEVEAQRLIHILGYTASDYGGAVAAGAIVNPAEYDEQLALLADAEKIAQRLKADPRVGVELASGVGRVRSLVQAKADGGEVSAAVAVVRAQVIAAFKLIDAPTAPPDEARGRSLYIEHCATCHGQTGRADTARAASLSPRPVNFHDPQVGAEMTPSRVASTVRFGINGTAMVPFTFLSDQDRWDLSFYTTGLRHGATPLTEKIEAPAYTLAELAVRSDAQLTGELRAAGIPEARHEAILAELRRRAPYDARASERPLAIARIKLDRARSAIAHGDRAIARGAIIDAYLEGIEPAEGPLRAMDAALAASLEQRFGFLRARLEAGAPPAEIEAGISAILGDLTRADMLLAMPASEQSFLSTAISSAGILLREGVEAALLIAALLGVAAQAGLAERRRYVHFGWASAVGLGVITWIVSSRLITLSGASRELIEGITALLATVVLFYVSYALLAKREVARWMKFLRAQVSPRRAALSLFGVAFLAAYREAFETVLFYQALLSSKTSTAAALLGALFGAAGLALVVAVYSRAGRFAPPQMFFRISSYLLYGLAVVFAGQGIAALQLTAVLPIHPLPIPSVPALGIYPTLETCVLQVILIGLAIVGKVVSARHGAGPAVVKPAASN